MPGAWNKFISDLKYFSWSLLPLPLSLSLSVLVLFNLYDVSLLNIYGCVVSIHTMALHARLRSSECSYLYPILVLITLGTSGASALFALLSWAVDVNHFDQSPLSWAVVFSLSLSLFFPSFLPSFLPLFLSFFLSVFDCFWYYSSSIDESSVQSRKYPVRDARTRRKSSWKRRNIWHKSHTVIRCRKLGAGKETSVSQSSPHELFPV